MGKVILLTGAPATGKSTLRRGLCDRFSSLHPFDYGQLLIERKAKEGVSLEYHELRTQSAEVITAADVGSLDEELIAGVSRMRETTDIIIDSHAVTREKYGFRVVPFSTDQLQRLRLDVVVILRCDPAAVLTRIAERGEGRREVDIELAREHQLLQEGIGISYGITCGCPVFVLDTTSLDEGALLAKVAILLEGCGLRL